MSDKLSFHECSMRIAEEAQSLVRAAAAPVMPGDTVKAQIRRAYSNLGRPAFWRVRAAWYGEAGSWSAAAIEEFRARYCAWRDRQERRGRADAADSLAGLISTVEALRATDPDFHSDTIAALERAIGAAGVSHRSVAPAE